MVKVLLKLAKARRKQSSKPTKSATFASTDDSVVSFSNHRTISDLETASSIDAESKSSTMTAAFDEMDPITNEHNADLSEVSNDDYSGDSRQLVVYDKSPMPPPPLPDAFHTFCINANLLIHSKEMKALMGSTQIVLVSALQSSGAVAASAGGMIVHVASLPVTIPLHLVGSAFDLVVGVGGHVARMAFGDSSCGESTSSVTPVEGWIHGIVNAVPNVIGTAGRITHEVGSTAVGVIGSMFGVETNRVEEGEPAQWERNLTSSGERSAEQAFFLDRLRLDIHLPGHEAPPTPPPIIVSAATPADISKYLLRVDDLNVFVSSEDPLNAVTHKAKVIYVDLGREFSDESLTTDALDQLMTKGLNVAGSNSTANVALYHPLQDRTHSKIQWKPEGTTAKILRKMKQKSIIECYKSLEKNILIWSGKFQGPPHYGSDNPVFMARGVVKRSPREFMKLLWDSDRTNEYNNFSLGRDDVIVIEDNIAEGGSYGAKVIKSETKVPFTGLSVGLFAVMYATALEGGSEDGFAIVCRSLRGGMAGCHVGGSRQRVETSLKNEILLGVNIMRAVPGNPDMTDLLSVSQVSSGMVPQFLAFKIGMMGVEDFFKNVR